VVRSPGLRSAPTGRRTRSRTSASRPASPGRRCRPLARRPCSGSS